MKMPVPTRRALGAAAALTLCAVIASFRPELQPAWAVMAGAFGLAALADLLAARARPARLEVQRTMPASVPIGRWRDCAVRVRNAARFAARCSLYDHHPATCEVEGLPLELAVPAQGYAEGRYRVRATERGDLDFEPAELRVLSPFRLWETTQRAGMRQRVRSYPDFARVADYALFATENRLSQIGVLQRRRRGEGLEFLQLREYREGDAIRQIDWKATARRGGLVSREYEDERDQQIVFLIDCGRRVGAREGLLSHFDEVLNAVLLLAFVALRQGDSAGLMTFAGDDARFVPPGKSRATLNRFLAALYDVQPTVRPPDFHAAAVDLARRVRRRSLVVLVTNMRDEDEETLHPALALLRRKHLVLIANLRESALDRLREGPIADLDDAVRYAAGAVYERDREAATQRARMSGAMLLDAPPQAFAASLVTRYLEIKRSGVF